MEVGTAKQGGMAMRSDTITAVGIDVSKGKSVVAIRRPGGKVVKPPFLVNHKKRSEGKHFYVYMVAGAAKFLRI